MSLSKLSKMPPEELSAVLNNPAIPLGRRLQLRLLSNRWCDILENGLTRETTLVIRDPVCIYPESQADDLVLEGGILTEEIIRTLVRLFPSLTQLSIVFRHSSLSWSIVPSLLAQLGTNLTTVKLYGNINEAMRAESLARALTNLPVLTSFTLDYSDCRLLPHLGPVLARLETFVCPNGGIPPESVSLISSSLSSRCTRLLLDQEVFDSFPDPILSQLSASLTHLQLLDCGPPVWQSLSQMHRLTSLALGINQDEMEENRFLVFAFRNLFRNLADHLAPCARLTDLKLLDLSYDARSPFAMPMKKEKPLSTVKRLTLEVSFDDENSKDYYEDSSDDDESSSDDDEDSPDDQHCPMDCQDASDDDEDSLDDYQTFFKAIAAWFPALTQLTLITDEESFPAIRACQDKLPFPVETVDSRHFYSMQPDF